MKRLKILNTVAIAIPIIISLFAIFNEEILLVALGTTMITGFLQLVAACIYWLKHPTNIHIKIYFAAVAVFFAMLYIFFDRYEFLFAMPAVLCIYLSFIIYSTPNEAA